MLQVFCLDVAKVDLDVAYTCMLQALFQVFWVFHTYVCKCFIWMLHMFAMVFKYFSDVFASVSDSCFKCFICLLLYVATVASDVLKLDRVLHMGYTWEAAVGTDDIRSDAGDIRGDTGPLLVRSRVSPTR